MRKCNTTVKRIIAFLLALILAVPSGIGDIAGIVYASTKDGGSTETEKTEPVNPEDIVLDIDWSESVYKDGDAFNLEETAPTFNGVKLRVSYSCKSVREEGYEAGELIITVKGIGGVNRSGVIEALVGADKQGADVSRHDWTYTWNKATDTYTLVNNEAIEGYSVFSGYFEFVWKVDARSSIHGYQQNDVEAMLYLPDGTSVQSETLSFSNRTKADTFKVDIQLGGISGYEGLTKDISNPNDYVFIRYNLASDTDKRNSRGLQSSYHLFTPDANGVGNGAIVISPHFSSTANGDGTYTIGMSTGWYYTQYIFVAYPKASYEGKEVIAGLARIGEYYEGDDAGNMTEQALAVATKTHVIPVDFSFSDPSGSIYDFEKDTWYDKYVSDRVIAERGGDVKGSDVVAGTDETFYLEGSLYNPTGKNFTLELVDDFLYILKNNGNYRELGKDANGNYIDEYSFKSVTIPGTSSLKNSNGISIASNVYTFKVYVAYGGALINTGADATPYVEGKLVTSSRTINLPAGVTAVAIVLEDIKETINFFSIPVVVNFHIQDTSGLEESEQDNLKTGQIVNTAFLKQYLDGVWVNDYYGEEHYNDKTNLGLAEKDKALYGNGEKYLDREKDNITLYEGDLNDYEATTSIGKVEKVGNKYTTTVSIGARFLFVDAKHPNKFSLYTILPKGLALNGYRVEEDIWDIMTLSGLDMSADELVEACTVEVITNYKNSKRTYIALHFDFGDKAVKQDGSITAKFNVKTGDYTEFVVYSAVVIDESISQYSLWKKPDNGSWAHDAELFTDIDGDGDTAELLSYDSASFKPDVIADSAQFLIAKYVQTSYSDGWTLEPDVPYVDFGSEYQYKLSVKNGSNASNNIVVMDILEAGEGAQWRGTLQSVDLSACEALGVTGTVYYSADASPGALNSGKWTTAKPGTVKAIAVDFGSSVLGEGQELSIILKMKAPDDLALKDKATKNAFSASLTMNDTKHDALDSNFTQVKLTAPRKSIIVTKVDAESGAQLSGAIFSLIAKDTGDVVATATSNEKGIAMFRDIPVDGTSYIIRETKAPYGYELGADAEVTMSDTDVRVTIANARKTGRIEVYKVNGFDKTVKVEGATYTLFDLNGNVVQTAITDANGVAVFENVTWNKYIVKETAAPAGYQLNETEFSVEINRENVAETYIIDTLNQQEDVKVHLDKFVTTVTGVQTTQPMPGATFELMRITGNGDWRVGLYVTDKNGQIDVIELPYGKYYFREYRAPVGYTKAEDVHFELNPNQKEVNLTVYNKQKAGSVIILKSDNLGNMVNGAEFTLYDATKTNILTVGKSDEAGVLRFDDLAWGTYYVKETAAPNGYVLDEEWKEIKIEPTALEVEIKCVNETKKGSVALTKTSETDSDVVIPGAVYTLYAADNSVIGTYTTDENGQIIVEGLEWGSYYFKEVEAPVGYGLSDELVRFSVNATNAGIQQQLSATDPVDARHITLTKRLKASEINFANGNPTFIFKVEGVDIEGKSHVYYRMVSFDKAYVTANTGNDGYVSQSIKIAGLVAGTYVATEMETSRYCLEGIFESTNATVSNDGNSVSFDLSAYKEASATFTNKNYEQQDYSDNQNLTNIIKKKAKLTAIKVEYGAVEVQANSAINHDLLSVTVFYDDGTTKELSFGEYILDTEQFSGINGDYAITVSFEDNGITRSGTFNVTVVGGVDRIVRLEASLLSSDPVSVYSPIKEDMFKVTAFFSNGDSRVLSGVPVLAPGTGTATTNTVGLEEVAGDVLTITSPGWSSGNNYSASMTEAKYYSEITFDGAEAIQITFDSASATESVSYDWIQIYDSNGTSKYKLGGTDFAGKTYIVEADYVKLAMRSDGSVQRKGFSATIVPLYQVLPEYTVSPNTAPGIAGEFDVTIDLDLNAVPNGGYPVSTEVKMEAKYEDPILMKGKDFNAKVPDSATAVEFTTAMAPAGVEMIDLSVEQNFSVVGWMENGTFYVSSQRGDVSVIADADCSEMFYNKSKLTFIGGKLDTSSVTNMYFMFDNCSGLISVDLSGWDISSVTRMNGMFYNCSSLTSVGDLSGWDTSSVTSMSNMFNGCSKLTTVGDLSGWDTSSVTNMGNMFYNCSSLTSLAGISGWDTSSVTSMNSMFSDCSSLTSVGDLSGWDTSSVTDMSDMFHNCSSLTSVGDLSGWDTSSVTDMSDMFHNCSSLTSLAGISGWDTSSVTSMYQMFYGCNGLTSLAGISGWDTSSVTDMSYMFSDCSSLTSLADISGWDTSSVTNMGYMFYGCSGLTSLAGISGWDTSSVKSMSGMFCRCSSLTSLADISGWNTSSVTNMNSMFAYCTGLTSIDGISNWDVFCVESMNSMFQTCSNLTSIDLSGWDISNVTKMEDMFHECHGNVTEAYALNQELAEKLNTLTSKAFACNFVVKGNVTESVLESGPSFNKHIPSGATTVVFTDIVAPDTVTLVDVSTARNGSVVAWLDGTVFYVSTQQNGVKVVANKVCRQMFYQKTSLTSVDFTMLDTSGTQIMYEMFYGCSKLTTVGDLSGWDTSSVTNMGYMFYGCSKLTTVGDLSDWDVSSVTNMGYMFRNCSSLTNLNLSSWDASSVTNMTDMFSGCSSLTSVGDLSGWDTSSVTSMSNMFNGCSKLTTVGDLSGWDTSSVTSMSNMFNGCSSLTSVGDLSGWDTSSVTRMNSMFYNCSSLTSLNLNGWDVSSVTDMTDMFSGCSSLTSVGDLSGWDTSSNKSAVRMFKGCNKLKNLDLSGWDTSSLTNMSGMFYSCGSLTSVGDLSGWDTSTVVNMGEMFYNCSSLTSLNLSGWDVSSITGVSNQWQYNGMSRMFYNCSSLTSLNLGGWDVSSVVDMSYMFSYCKKLTLDCSSWNVVKVTSHSNFNISAPGVIAPNWVN